MIEHIARGVYYLEIHLLYASIAWCAAWVLTSIRGASATAKYWVWVAASLNFILPLGAVIDKLWAAHLSWARPIGLIGDVGGKRLAKRECGCPGMVSWRNPDACEALA